MENGSRFAKFANFFPYQNFPVYGIHPSYIYCSEEAPSNISSLQEMGSAQYMHSIAIVSVCTYVPFMTLTDGFIGVRSKAAVLLVNTVVGKVNESV